MFRVDTNTGVAGMLSALAACEENRTTVIDARLEFSNTSSTACLTNPFSTCIAFDQCVLGFVLGFEENFENSSLEMLQNSSQSGYFYQ